MRINTGMKVEAWQRNGNARSWAAAGGAQARWCGGNGGAVVSGRIQRVDVRPTPPPLPILTDLEPGVHIEVFDQSMWKLAKFVSSGDQAGSTSADEFTVKIVTTPSVDVTLPRSMALSNI
uniref:Uncharacterized protein n=1 Tax=Leersia perrieri TaxID=77586 RepID=A0A0D9V2T8_9ORYZ